MSDGFGARAARRTYRGVWKILRDWFRVPEHAPSLPAPPGGSVIAMQPAEGYLRYLTFQFWLLLVIFDLGLIGGWIVILAVNPLVGAIIAVPVWLVAIVPDIVAYVAIHLRYDTTWYVLSDRSMRLRRGIWIINEVTITFENVQNVSVKQGPVQRYFGIADVVVQTAGGATGGPHGTTSASGHEGILEGVANASELREMVMARVRASRKAGLGDEHHAPLAMQSAQRWTDAHLEALRSIRDGVRALRTT